MDTQPETKFFQTPNFTLRATIGVLIAFIIILIVLAVYYILMAKNCTSGYKGSTEENKKILQDLAKLKKQITDMEAEAVILKQKAAMGDICSKKLEECKEEVLFLFLNVKVAHEYVQSIKDYVEKGGLSSGTIGNLNTAFNISLQTVSEKYPRFGGNVIGGMLSTLLSITTSSKNQINELSDKLKECEKNKQINQI
jgi:hypothetical protein